MKYTTEDMFSRRWNAAYKSGTDQQQKCLDLINTIWSLFRDKLPNAIETDTEVCGLDRNVFNKPSHMMLAFEVYPNEALLGVKDFFTVVVSPDGFMELDNLITGSTIKSSLSNQKEVISELRDIKNEFIRTYGRTEKFGESKKHACSMQKKIESLQTKTNENAEIARNACGSLVNYIGSIGDDIILSINDFSDKDTFIKHVEQFIAKNYVKAFNKEILDEVEKAVINYVKHSVGKA